MYKEEFYDLEIGTEVIISRACWLSFLDFNQDILMSGWDLIVPSLKIIDVDCVPYDGSSLYLFEFRGRKFHCWYTDIEEIS